MSFQLHDTLLRHKVPLTTAEPGKVRIYNCGPTVYGQAHIGNFRAFVFADMLRRWLEIAGYEVTQVMNITDVGHMRDEDPEHGEDKMEAAALKEQLDPWKIAEKYTDLFLADVDLLRIQRAHQYPRATAFIPQMITQIEQLLERGHAYEAGGNIYFDVNSFEDYGLLSGNTGDDLIPGARVGVLNEKRDPRDFALWKRDKHHIMQWDSPFGRGFPGWHIECSAMGQHLLGETLDIHTGGEDNIFPHHECEIAQGQSATGKTFSRHWMHTRFLQVEGRKMSKSLGNLYTVEQLGEMGHSPVAVRFALLRAQYRQVINFTFDGLKEAANNVRRLRLFAEELEQRAAGSAAQDVPEWVAQCVARFDDSMNDDLNVSGALDGVFTLVHEGHRRQPEGAEAAAALVALRRFDRLLDVLRVDTEASDGTEDQAIEELVQRRNQARADKNWAAADALRSELAALGVEMFDGKDGKASWRRIQI
ncbi:MAG: cysteinyl-tRNA synthetase [Pseudohongiellaceae bacterium]|jgi:cysteinyl-tRNA synthetase